MKLTPRHTHTIVAAVMLVAGNAMAASSLPSGTTNMLRANGEGDTIASGDWVSEPTGGLGTFYSYFIEVPSGLGSLVVEVFDAEVGAGAGAEGSRDLQTGAAFNTSVAYLLFNPSGTQVGSTVTCTNSGASPCLDNAWSSLFGTQSSPAAGHWELRVNLGTGDDTVGYGVRAHDGTSGSGGTELPVYAHSFLNFGPTNLTSQTNTIYPFVTSGCQARANDFDNDGNTSSLAFTGANDFSQTVTTLSANNAWATRLTNAFSADSGADDYGIWTTVATIAKASGSANPITFYMGAFNSTAAGTSGAPTAQPEANTFRIYLPTDAGGVPVKPKVEQFARYLDGPNPPTAGVESRYKVTVRVDNPTSSAITFSSTNLVTVNVPGSTATYGGNASVSQGSIVSQPAVAGTGNITWNPGTVAAGAAALLYYEVRVTPATSSSRVVLTGTPTTNGTTAVYVDETGNTTQARATYTFGPLCEVAVTAGVTTLASIADVFAHTSANGMTYHVAIASEVGTAGYALERLDASSGTFVRVHDGVVAVAQPNPRGRVLEVTEPGVWFDEASVRVVEYEYDGNIRVHGPFGVVADAQVDETPISPPVALHPVPPEISARAVGEPRVELRVSHPGLQAVPVRQIGTALATSAAQLKHQLVAQRLRLTRDGVDVPYGYDENADVLWFVGEAGHDAWDADGVYELRAGLGQAFERYTAVDVPAQVEPAVRAFVASEHEDDVLLLTAVPQNPRGDFWYEAALVGGDPTSVHVKKLPGATGGTARLTVRLFGATDAAHRVALTVNGVEVGEVRFDGVRAVAQEFEIDWPHDDAEVRLFADAAEALSVVFVDGFSLVRLTDLELPARVVGDGRFVQVGRAFVVDESLGSMIEHDGRLLLREGHRYAVASVTAAHRPRVIADAAVQRPAPTSDVVIVAADRFVDAAGALQAMHAARGYSSEVVAVSDLYDAYSHGRRTPNAIQAYLRDAVAHGATHAVLLGAGSTDERNLLGSNDALIPVPLRTSPFGIVSNDAAYADPDGDGILDLAVGRLPFVDVDAFLAYVNVARTAQPLASSFVLSDRLDGEVDFAGSAIDVAETLPWPREVVSTDAVGVDAARGALLARFEDASPQMLLYVGHAGLDRLSNDGVLSAADLNAAAVTPSGNRLMVALACVLNRFEEPAYAALGESMLQKGAASLVLAPADVVRHESSEAIGRALTAELVAARSVGDAWVRAAKTSPAASSYVLLGDPTMPAGQAAAASTPGCSQKGGGMWVAALPILWHWRRRRVISPQRSS